MPPIGARSWCWTGQGLAEGLPPGPAIQRQRTLLRDVVGLDRRAVKTQPYWAEGKTGL